MTSNDEHVPNANGTKSNQASPGNVGVLSPDGFGQDLNTAPSGFKVSRQELLALCREWFTEAQLYRWSEFVGSTWSSFSKGCDYAICRVADIRAAVGEGPVRQAIAEVNRSMGHRFGAETWRIFTEGTDQEREALRREIEDEGDRCGGKARDPKTAAAPAAYLREHPSGVFIDDDGDMWYLTDGAYGGLDLGIVSPAGQFFICAPGFVFDRPPDWFRPYGLP